MKKLSVLLALASLLACPLAHAISLDDIQLWTGSGTNRAALVIQWNPPEIYNNTTVPAPVANKTLVWGYRFNGSATGTQLFNAIVASDPRLYVVENIDPTFGTGVDAIGYNLNATGIVGVSDGTITDSAATFTNGVLVDPQLNVDAAYSLNGGDLFWSGHDGPYWQLWNELGDAGGFMDSPNRGTNAFWDSSTYTQGQWASAYSGLDGLPITDGSWIGFSISAAGYDDDPNDPAYYAFNDDEQAPPSPDGTYVAYVANTNDFAVAIVSTNNIYPVSPYNDPASVLNQPALTFFDPYDGAVTDRVSIIDPVFNVTPTGAKVITEISSGGKITVRLGRKIYDDTNNPYGVDLLVYGNSFFSAAGARGPISDQTDLNSVTLSSGYSGHGTAVSVSPDGTNWYTFTNQASLYPDEAFRWDDTNDAWTDEAMNPTKPFNPYLYTNNFGGQTAASALDQFVGAAGGSGFDLHASGFPWIQYVRVQPVGASYTVIDAIAAVNPVAVGDALSISQDSLASGNNRLAFQNPGDLTRNQICIDFDSVDEITKISTVVLNDFSPFAPVEGSVSAAYQIQARPLLGISLPSYSAGVSLRVADDYSGNGSDLRVFLWQNTNWTSQPFSYSTVSHQVLVAGVTNFSAFVISQIVPPILKIQTLANGVAFQFTPVPNCHETLERSSDLRTWLPVNSFTATNGQPMHLQDTNAPAGNAFYRLLLNP